MTVDQEWVRPGWGEAWTACAVKGPQSQELLESLMRGLEALADACWGRLRSSGVGGVGGGDGAKQHAGGAHALSGVPAMGLRLRGFLL